MPKSVMSKNKAKNMALSVADELAGTMKFNKRPTKITNKF